MRSVKKFSAASAAFVTALALAACGSNETSGGSDGASGSGKDGGGEMKAALAFDVGGEGDHSFNDSAAKGFDEAGEEFGIKTQKVQASNGENEAAREQRLQQLAQAGNKAVVAVGFAYAPAIGKVAKQFPDVKFAIVDDSSPDSKGDNVDQITFTEEQGSFLAGAAAALKTKSNHIGFVGGVENGLIQKFEAGFVQGAKKVKPNIKIDVKYLTPDGDFSGFADPAKGKTAATGMYQSGADIVYHAAGKSGDGVFQAAKAAGKGNWVIGVDSDQAQTAPADVRPFILTSMMKSVDVGVKEFLEEVHSGDFKGGNSVLGLKDDGVRLATTGGHLDDIKDKLDGFKKEIVDGTIKVSAKR